MSKKRHNVRNGIRVRTRSNLFDFWLIVYEILILLVGPLPIASQVNFATVGTHEEIEHSCTAPTDEPWRGVKSPN